METTKESAIKKGKRPKSATRYPKRMPTFVVAFAVQESHDDPAKTQQIHNKRSLENNALSTKSISPSGSTNSAKTFTITPTEKLSRVLDIPTISEVKINIIDDNQCGDIEKKSPQISSYIVVDNRMVDEQPEVIFDATKHVKRSKDINKFPRKKPKKNKRVIKFKNVHFKYKNPKKNITRRLEKYYEKAKMNSPNLEQIQQQIYHNGLSKVVSRSRVLKKVLAKENLLDGADRLSLYDGISVNEYDDGSLNSSPSTTKKSFISDASQDTLVHKSSSSSRNEDFYSINNVSSVIQVSSELTPFKTDIINVAVAVAFSSSKPNQNISNEKFLHNECLTSDETFLLPNVDLTSGCPSDNFKYPKIEYDKLKPLALNEKEMSNATLTGFEKTSIVAESSDDDTFVIARTSSDFNKSSINSDFTLTSNSETVVRADSIHPNILNQNDFEHTKRAALLDTVINLGFYPEMTASTSSGANFNCDLNDVMISENYKRKFHLNPKNKGDEIPTDAKNNLSNVLKKAFDMEKIAYPQKNISLPNEIAIKAKLKEAEKEQRKSGFEEVKDNYPTDLSEMWDRLTLVLDLAVKRLEETLADKILKELKKSLAIFHQDQYKVNKSEIQPRETLLAETQIKEQPSSKMFHKEICVIEDHLKADADECLQCNLVQNQVIDQLMLKLSVEGPKPVASTSSLKKLKKPQIVKDYFEILKPPLGTEPSMKERGRGDTVTVSTATAEFRDNEQFPGIQGRVKTLLRGPISFIRANFFVLTSVPSFFIVLLCLYGLIVLVMNM